MTDPEPVPVPLGDPDTARTLAHFEQQVENAQKLYYRALPDQQPDAWERLNDAQRRCAGYARVTNQIPSVNCGAWS